MQEREAEILLKELRLGRAQKVMARGAADWGEREGWGDGGSFWGGGRELSPEPYLVQGKMDKRLQSK